MACERSGQAGQDSAALFGRSEGRASNDSALGEGLHAEDQKVAAVVGDVVGGLVPGADQRWPCVKQDGGFNLATMHVFMRVAGEATVPPCPLPVIARRE